MPYTMECLGETCASSPTGCPQKRFPEVVPGIYKVCHKPVLKTLVCIHLIRHEGLKRPDQTKTAHIELKNIQNKPIPLKMQHYLKLTPIQTDMMYSKADENSSWQGNMYFKNRFVVNCILLL